MGWSSLVAQSVKNLCLQCRRPGFDPLVRKIPWRRAWQHTPVFWPGECPWTEEHGGLQSMGLQRVGHNWVTKHRLFSFVFACSHFSAQTYSLTKVFHRQKAGRIHGGGRWGQARSCSVSQSSMNPPLEHFFLCHLLYLVPLSCQNALYLPAWSYPPWSTVTSTWCSPHLTVSDCWVPSFFPCLYGKALGLVTMDSCEMLSVESPVKVAQSCPTLCDPIDYTVHGILQARILEWVAFPFSRGSSQPRDRTQVSSVAGRFFTSWATREAQEYWSG